MMHYAKFFELVTRCSPFAYQQELGVKPWPDLVVIPTGLGKTAGVVVAWLWKNLNRDSETPRRLAYCLPMRVLVEQTRDCVAKWVAEATPVFEARGTAVPGVHLLLGGETDAPWTARPETPAIIIGTQDMLLSRLLMRGYGMSRYQWPVHFALLHNDVLWVFDEVQLMGAGLPTSAQLEAFRRRFSLARHSRSVWLSATLNPEWLATVDMAPHCAGLRHLRLSDEECESQPVRVRREAVKRLHKAQTKITAENQKQCAKTYAEALAGEIVQNHVGGTTTLVVVNTVERCQALLKAVDKLGLSAEAFLVHSRFRPDDRRNLNQMLMIPPAPDGPGRIVIATQAVEAGVDMTSSILFTELAPWSSLVQRFGRCNRYGEAAEAGADVLWIDSEEESKLAIPYAPAELSLARSKLAGLESASPANLPVFDEAAPLHPVIRAKDFQDLFNTDPDLTGFDVDISPFIRDADDLDVQIFWRDLSPGVEEQPLPRMPELCRASISQARALLESLHKRELRAYRWDSLDGRWRSHSGDLRPGLVLMADVKAGGYSDRLGFDPSNKERVAPLLAEAVEGGTETFAGDVRSRMDRPVTLARHLSDAAEVTLELCKALNSTPEERSPVVIAASWHDVGKAHRVFQATMHGCTLEQAEARTPLLAKSPSNGLHQRKHFRHELASMLAWLAHRNGHEEADLIAYLIASHHGKVRLSLRSVPDESEPTSPFGPRFARGVWENETLPQVEWVDGDGIPSTILRLDLMELGEGAMGPSWTARTRAVLDRFGPFRLAWLESLVRIADWRASAAEGEEQA
jgi:CRISPR-associated endonuclease/helicase Cas3